jgi:hypothetical protein
MTFPRAVQHEPSRPDLIPPKSIPERNISEVQLRPVPAPCFPACHTTPPLCVSPVKSLASKSSQGVNADSAEKEAKA